VAAAIVAFVVLYFLQANASLGSRFFSQPAYTGPK
jgi:hypothetical protein